MTLSGSGALPVEEGDAPSSEDGIMTAALRAELESLYQEHSTGLVRHLARRTGCDETARDLAQETFLRLLRLTPARALTIRQPEAYLKRISTNLLRDWSRSRVRRLALAQANPEPPAQHLDQVAILESRDTLRRLELAMSRLKPRTREIFVAHRLDGLSYSEIAERTGLSVKGVEKQMSKAIAKIDRLLDRP